MRELNLASQIPRSETLTSSVTNVTDHNRTPLVLTFHPFNFKVRDVIRKNFHILKNDPETSSIFSNNPLVSFRHSKNIRETLVHSNLPQELSSPCATFPCGVGQCKTCKFIDSSTTISAPKFVYHIKHHFTCTSSHLIYCISCSRCGMLYKMPWIMRGRCLMKKRDMLICAKHRAHLGQYWSIPNACKHPGHKGGKKAAKTNCTFTLAIGQDVWKVFGVVIPVGARKYP